VETSAKTSSAVFWKGLALTIKLIPVGDLSPAAYNPRVAIPERMELVRLSLQKLGFLLPIVATSDNEILSGHQRHHTATNMGFDKVPVLQTGDLGEPDRKTLNIIANRGTNDMQVTSHAAQMYDELKRRVFEASKAIPDAADPYPCLTVKSLSLAKLSDACRNRFDAHMRNMNRSFHRVTGLRMPVVVTESGRVVNGVGRIQYHREQGEDYYPAVIIDEGIADFADMMLNLLSMEFNIQEKYEDDLRFTSFRRAWNTRKKLGMGMTAQLPIPQKQWVGFNLSTPKQRAVWKRTYGTTVCDFGAGHLHEAEMLRSIGVDVTTFEPYHVGKDGKIDKSASLRINRAFLETIAAGKTFDSVFLSSVLNSIPYRADREKVLLICAALCSEQTVFHSTAMTCEQSLFRGVAKGLEYNERQQQRTTFLLNYEPGITVALGDSGRPKVQKYHMASEFYDILRHAFHQVEVKTVQKTHIGRCKGPVNDLQRLREAIEFEFDLPYPDGSRMGLVGDAIDAFSQRLGVKL
jgi:hypothetical protein